MYAIIETGGKQYRVEKGDVIDVELLKADEQGGIAFEVLFLNRDGNVSVGTPHITGSVVKGKLLDEIKGPKVVSYKYKRRKNQRRKVGHRQKYSRIEIVEIEG